MTKRQRSKELEQEILDYYEHRCARCGSSWQIQIHELTPRSSFGNLSNPFTLENSLVLCSNCHNHIHATGLRNHLTQLIQYQDEAKVKHAKQRTTSK